MAYSRCGLTITKYDSKERDTMIQLLTKHLLIDSDSTPVIKELAETVSTNIVDACQSIPKFKYQHSSCIVKLAMNFKRDPGFRADVLHGRINPSELVRNHISNFASDRLKFDIAGYAEEGLNASIKKQEESSSGSDIKCPQCGKFNVTYTQAQTRSADEPMTTFYYCTDCGKRWKG